MSRVYPIPPCKQSATERLRRSVADAPRRGRLNPWDGQDVEGVEGFNLGIAAKIRVVESQEPGNAVLDHEGHQANVVSLLALNGVLGDQAFPSGIDLRRLRENLKDGTSGGDLRDMPARE